MRDPAWYCNKYGGLIRAGPCGNVLWERYLEGDVEVEIVTTKEQFTDLLLGKTTESTTRPLSTLGPHPPRLFREGASSRSRHQPTPKDQELK